MKRKVLAVSVDRTWDGLPREEMTFGCQQLSNRSWGFAEGSSMWIEVGCYGLSVIYSCPGGEPALGSALKSTCPVLAVSNLWRSATGPWQVWSFFYASFVLKINSLFKSNFQQIFSLTCQPFPHCSKRERIHSLEYYSAIKRNKVLVDGSHGGLVKTLGKLEEASHRRSHIILFHSLSVHHGEI